MIVASFFKTSGFPRLRAESLVGVPGCKSRLFETATPPPASEAQEYLYRVSLVRTPTSEIRNVSRRIRELLSRQLHRQGVRCHPGSRMVLTWWESPQVQLAGIQDMRSMFARR